VYYSQLKCTLDVRKYSEENIILLEEHAASYLIFEVSAFSLFIALALQNLRFQNMKTRTKIRHAIIRPPTPQNHHPIGHRFVATKHFKPLYRQCAPSSNKNGLSGHREPCTMCMEALKHCTIKDVRQSSFQPCSRKFSTEVDEMISLNSMVFCNLRSITFR
jgi:hypothetical protein